MNDREERDILSETALGAIPPDTVITRATLFNAFTGEFIPKQSVWIKDGRIAFAGPDSIEPKEGCKDMIDAGGKVLLPGLIDGHTHLHRTGIEEFVRHVIPGGTTTVIMETIEPALICGKKAIELLVEGLKDQPIRFYHTVTPLCGLTPSNEINAFSNEEALSLLRHPMAAGLGELYWGNLLLKGSQGERVRELASMTLGLGKSVEGHSAGATGRKLQGYASFGVSSCHEPITEEEVLERLRLGFWAMIRQGAIRKELEGVKGIFKRKIDFRRLVLVTDGADPEGFIKEGYLDASLRSALKMGVPPGLAYQMVTLNAAEHFGLDHLIGSLSPGRMADILMIPSPEKFSPELIMCGGKIILKNGKVLVEPRKTLFPEAFFDTVSIPEESFPPLPAKGKARAMELVTRLVTKETIVDFEGPEESPGESKDINMILAIDRVGNGKAFMGLLKGFGLRQGAVGSTMCWDVVDLIVVGCDLRSIKTVVGRLKELRGGAVFAVGDEIVAEYPAPLFGLLSIKPMAMIRDEIKKLEESLRKYGVKWENPLLTVDVLGTAAIPHLRITHEGYVRLKDRKILSLEI
jgi:adenine deaminase